MVSILSAPWGIRIRGLWKLQSILKKSVLNIHWKDWFWSWSSNTVATWCKEMTYWGGKKNPDAGKDWRQEKGATEDEMIRWHHRLDGHEFEQAPGAGDGQGGLVVLHPMGLQRVRHEWATELNWTDKTIMAPFGSLHSSPMSMVNGRFITYFY